MCSPFTALVPPHSSPLLFLCHSLLASGVLTATDCAPLFVRNWSADKEIHRNMAGRHSSRRVIQYEWNTSSSAGCVCLECVCENWQWRNKDLSRDLYSSDRETKRWRDKIERPRQKRERRSKMEMERVRNNLFSLCAWLAGVLYLTPSPNTACLHRHKRRK